MKRIISLIGLFLLIVSPCFASSRSYVTTIIDNQLIDNSPTSVTSSGYYVGSANKIGFFVTYDETQVGATVSGAVTLDISWDGTNWLTGASFFDFAGGATLQTSETLSSDSTYFFWVENAAPFMYVRVKVAGTSTDADDTILTTVKMIVQED